MLYSQLFITTIARRREEPILSIEQGKRTMGSEKKAGRADGRFMASLPARLLCEGKEHTCVAYELSRSGVLLTGELPSPEIPDVEVIISSSAGDLELHVTAALVHVQRNEEDGRTRLGLQFQELTTEQKKTVEAMVYRVMEGMAPAALDSLSKKASAGEIRQALNNIPLPHRIMLARRGQVDERKIIRHDTNPEVLEALARNPTIMLPEIMALARVRHLAPSTVTLLSEDPRWAGNEELKLLLATHPRVTFQTADRIASSLGEQALQRLLRRSGLQPGIRKKLMVKLAHEAKRT
jgi:hypothetical protein